MHWLGSAAESISVSGSQRRESPPGDNTDAFGDSLDFCWPLDRSSEIKAKFNYRAHPLSNQVFSGRYIIFVGQVF